MVGVFLGIALLSIAGASVALANGGPHVGTFTGTTDSCGGCHRTHSAAAAKLLDTANQYALCASCHGGTGADTDVVHGIYLGSTQGQQNNGLKGGGFEQALMNAGLSTSFVPNNVAASEPVTSRHTLGVSNVIVWASANVTGNVGEVVPAGLDCGDCHNPHGNANYRMLRPQPTALAAWSPAPPTTGSPAGSPVRAATSLVMRPVTWVDSTHVGIHDSGMFSSSRTVLLHLRLATSSSEVPDASETSVT